MADLTNDPLLLALQGAQSAWEVELGAIDRDEMQAFDKPSVRVWLELQVMALAEVAQQLGYRRSASHLARALISVTQDAEGRTSAVSAAQPAVVLPFPKSQSSA